MYIITGKATVDIITSDSLFKELHVQFTTLPFKSFSNNKEINYVKILSCLCYINLQATLPEKSYFKIINF